jgi:hypothetical protein
MYYIDSLLMYYATLLADCYFYAVIIERYIAFIRKK